MPKFNPPESFNFERPSDWQEWKERFARYRLASKLHKDDEDIQISALIYAMGRQAEHIFKSFVFATDGDDKKYDRVLEKFDEYFVPKRNTIHERARFHLRVQNPGESVECFIRTLHELAEHCNFDDKSEQIRDRLVIGIRDKELSEKMQLRADLTLEKACEMARNSELVKSQIKDLQSNNLDAISHPKQNTSRSQAASGSGARGYTRGQGHRRGQRQPHYPRQTKPCTACNRKHPPQQCPAFGRECRKCGGLNHFKVCCRSRNDRGVSEVRDSDETYFLGSVTDCHDTEAWYTKLRICGRIIPFKIDTGADISIISEKTYKSLSFQPKLSAVTSKLQTPSGNLECLGKFKITTRFRGKAYSFHVAVIPGSHVQNNLLSRSVASTMGLISKVDTIVEHYAMMKGEPVKIELRPEVPPYCVTTARRIPFPLMPKVKDELDRLERNGIIRKITEPTDWCSPIVPVTKRNGSVRICVDLKRLNEAVKREHYMLPNLEDIAPKLSGATVFSKLDAACGFHQVPLSEESQKLTTFITPFGRYCYTRMPFGISSAPEIFQRRISEILSGLDGVESIIDDVIIYGKTKSEHDHRLDLAMQRIKDSGIKLNSEKCEFRKDRIEYFGHIISKDGVLPNPERVRAIVEMPPPENVADLRRIIGMITYLGRFIPDLSTVMNPINSLLKTDTAWSWDQPQIDAFEKVKQLITNAPVLAYYDISKPTVVSADASSYGVGAAIFQQFDNELKPIAYASRTLTDSEKKYAQIEKECLAGVWACEKFERYLSGIDSFQLITDHKPLVPLINTQDLNKAPLRCQRLLMRLRRFNLTAKHVPGKQLVVPDTLSRSPISDFESSTIEDVSAYVDCVIHNKPLSDTKLKEIKACTSTDPVLPDIMRYTLSGWQNKESSLFPEVKPYFSSRYEISISDGILLYRDRLIIPEAMREDVLKAIHTGHLGLNKCRERAKLSVWWPGLSQDIENLVRNCEFCNINKGKQRSEPLKTTTLPSRPWVRIGADLCDFDGKNYLVVMDYFSRFLEIAYLDAITSDHVIGKLKNMFSRWGIPEQLVSDNGTQFTSKSFKDFAQSYGFQQIFSSPHYPQANGEAEIAVKIAKRILKQPDIFLALMAYRSTPISATGKSPSELLMGRRIRTTVPVSPKQLQPDWSCLTDVRNRDGIAKRRMRRNFNRSHGVQSLPPLIIGDRVRLKTDKEKNWHESGVVTSANYHNRSYEVKTQRGTFRRNRRHIQFVGGEVQESLPIRAYDADVDTDRLPVSEPPATCKTVPNNAKDVALPSNTPNICEPETTPEAVSQQSPVRTRSGREVKKPSYLSDYITEVFV
ncbi:hypothetical protein FSP39_001659 [Pinctada imbricata]|uniref:Endonuclease n=1 Tax=Pinctada imbricata TaxID=66713 RepID=A0AA89BK15_PINIB|nr:hypothetical protein FSP39_001659 [Pinctada imbricata]